MLRRIQTATPTSLTLVNVSVISVHKRHLTQLIKILESLHPLPELHHLKRIKSSKDSDVANVIYKISDIIEEIDVRVSAFVVDLPSIVPVPLHPAPSKELFEEWKKYWPMSYIARPNDPHILCAEEEQTAIETLNRLSSSNPGILMDSDHQIVFELVGFKKEHVLDHCCMRLIEMVASRDRKRPSGKRILSDSYLCTGYDIYLYTEPCVMCAMALVHSRIRRIFFINRNLQNGGVVSKVMLHSIPSLNHHFAVYELEQPPQ